MAALDLGINVVKFFPAATCGGLPAMTALAAAFPGLRFVPTGGVNPDNLSTYLASPIVAACGGSWMVNKALIDHAAWNDITRLSAQAFTIAQEAGR